MGERGPQKKPLIQRVADGNAGHITKEQLNLNQPTPEPCSEHEPMGHLTEVAKKEFEILKELLYPEGLLTKIDGHQLQVLAQAFGRWVQVDELINKTSILIKDDKGNPKMNPLFKESIRLMELVTKNLSAFGMSPASRARVSASTDKEKNQEDAWSKLVRQRAELKAQKLAK